MIPEEITMKSCIKRYATLDRDIHNGDGEGMGAGCRVIIISANNRGMTVQTEKCPCCQQFATISNVKRCDLTLIK